MSTALEKTSNLIRCNWPIDKIDTNPLNPNEMSAATFNMLSDNIELMGVTDPILCVPHPEKECDVAARTGWLMLIGGEHRLEVAKLHELPEMPVTINVDPDFDQELQKFQIVRHNIIHGQMNPQKFVALYQSLNSEYTEEVAAQMFGFVEQNEFLSLIRKTKASLPKELQPAFQEAAKDIKTVNDLTNVLNRLFTDYGDTLDYNYMVVDFGGKDSIWLRMQQAEYARFMEFATNCKEASRTVDHVVMALVKKAQSEPEFFAELVKDLPEFSMKSIQGIGTLDYLDDL